MEPSSARNTVSYGVKIAKIGPVDPEIFDEIRQFFEPCQLWSYWTEFHEIFTQYTGTSSLLMRTMR